MVAILRPALLFFSLAFLSISFSAQALTLTNKSEEIVLVILKDRGFVTLEKFFIEPHATEHRQLPGGKKVFYQVEVRFPVKEELSESPHFFQEVEAKDKICVPERLCHN